MLEHVRRASITRLSRTSAAHLEDAPSQYGRRSHGRLSFDANHLVKCVVADDPALTLRRASRITTCRPSRGWTRTGHAYPVASGIACR